MQPIEGKFKTALKLECIWEYQKNLKVVLHETKGDEQTVSYICIRAVLKHTKKLFIPF